MAYSVQPVMQEGREEKNPEAGWSGCSAFDIGNSSLQTPLFSKELTKYLFIHF